jgi:hypothetical protein
MCVWSLMAAVILFSFAPHSHLKKKVIHESIEARATFERNDVLLFSLEKIASQFSLDC